MTSALSGVGGADRKVRGYRNAIAAPLYFRHDASLHHDTGAHPERPERILAIESELERQGWLGYEVTQAPVAGEQQLLAVHPRSHVERVRETCERGGSFDLDTPASPGSWDAALRAAGAGCALVDALLAGDAPTGFCALRPPGHHAEPARAMGFCLFANAAIAARHALVEHGAERVLVLDWDVHHGNGTAACFRASPEVLFASIHQWPFYPGTGALTDTGAGEGEGFTINLPVPAGAGEDEFLGLLQHVVVPAARDYRPDLILVSAGSDAHRDDPLAGCRLETSSYGELARTVRGLADELGVRCGALLEGGYDTGALAASTAAVMEGLAGGEEARVAPRGELIEAAAKVAGRTFPAVRG